jgi:hypothetical protein
MTPKQYNDREIAAGRLTLEHVLAIVEGSAPLAELVRTFQKQHGLDVDGKAGPTTRSEALMPEYVLSPNDAAPPAWGDLRIRPTTRAQACENFLRYVGQGIYRMGGGADVFAPAPFRNGFVDCSALTAWCTGHSRAQPFASLNTDGVLRDCRNGQRVYRFVGADEAVEPGDLLTKGGIFEDGRRVKAGHTGGVVEILPGFERGSRVKDREWWRYVRVVHSVGPNGKNPTVKIGNAISWAESGYFVRPLWYV